MGCDKIPGPLVRGVTTLGGNHFDCWRPGLRPAEAGRNPEASTIPLGWGKNITMKANNVEERPLLPKAFHPASWKRSCRGDCLNFCEESVFLAGTAAATRTAASSGYPAIRCARALVFAGFRAVTAGVCSNSFR
jgi:hypothetical protein